MNSNERNSLQVHVDLQERSYEIAITTDGWQKFPEWTASWLDKADHWRAEQHRALIVTDENVAKRFGEKVLGHFQNQNWEISQLVLPAGENSKSFTQLQIIYDALVARKADRKFLVIAVGGGVMGDLAGFAAASYNRGLPFLQVPTTLLADVDSSVGGKVGINHPQGKNLIGAFHQPVGVLIETDCLQTLPDRDYRSGLAEVVKYGYILDAEFITELENSIPAIASRNPETLRQIVARCCRLKADVVEQDEFERSGLRAILNYGHTFAHAYEALCGYGQLTHGEAVAIGMMDAAELACRLGRVESTFVERQATLLQGLGLPVRLDTSARKSAAEYIEVMRLDKKSVGGQLRFILPTKYGHVDMVPDVPEQLVQEVLERKS